MSAAREAILGRIRAALGRDGEDDFAEVRARIAQHPRQIEPAFAEPLAQRFCARLEAAAASVAQVDSATGIGPEIERYLDAAGLERRVVVSGEDLLRRLDWPASIEVEQRLPEGSDQVGLTSALCGIAETGTLVLLSGPDNPTRLNFLPDHHIVVVPAERLLARMEDAWDCLRETCARMPRTVNFISGPSKTADIEQTVEYGAHGPRCLHVILLGRSD